MGVKIWGDIMGKKSVVLGIAGALLVGGSLAFTGPTLASATPKPMAPPITHEAAKGISWDAWRADAFATFSAGMADQSDAKAGFDATYIGTYLVSPNAKMLNLGYGYVVEKSATHPGVYHIFSLSPGNHAPGTQTS